MNNIIFPSLFSLCITLSSCASDSSCVERISHGPWEAIGTPPPKKVSVEHAYIKGGVPMLLSKFGDPIERSKEGVTWLFEARSISERKRCSPQRTELIYDQSFTIITVKHGHESDECHYEVREFISNEIFSPKRLADIPRSSLGLKEVACGIFPNNGLDKWDGG